MIIAVAVGSLARAVHKGEASTVVPISQYTNRTFCFREMWARIMGYVDQPQPPQPQPPQPPQRQRQLGGSHAPRSLLAVRARLRRFLACVTYHAPGTPTHHAAPQRFFRRTTCVLVQARPHSLQRSVRSAWTTPALSTGSFTLHA
jgi:hypothetical protein